MYEHLLYEVEDKTAVITVNNPKSLNALNSATLRELDECLAAAESDENLRVVIVTGAGPKSFVAGADISEMVNSSAAEGRAMALLADRAFGRLESMSKVTIAAVNGFALGGGCELALACDIRIVSENAVFGQTECGLGIIPGFGGTQRLARVVGKGRAKELIFTCDRIKADEAYRIGLANKVVSADELMNACMAMAAAIISKSGYAIGVAKACIETGLDTDLGSGLKFEANGFGLTFAGEDKAEGMTAFLEKRPPCFK